MTRNITSNDALKRLAFANPQWRLTVGDAHSTGAYFSDVAVDNTKQLYFKNATTDTYYGVYGITVRTSAEAQITKAFNATEDTEGDPPPDGITNKRSGGNGTDAVVRVGGDTEVGAYSGGTTFNPKGTGAGSGGNANPGETSSGGFVNVLDPGDSLLVGVQNTSGAKMSYLSVDLDWADIPEATYPA